MINKFSLYLFLALAFFSLDANAQQFWQPNRIATASSGTSGAITETVYDITNSVYNADPTGLTSSNTAINSAVTDSIASGHPVYVPKGTFLKTSSVSMVTASGCPSIYGDGPDSVINFDMGDGIGSHAYPGIITDTKKLCGSVRGLRLNVLTNTNVTNQNPLAKAIQLGNAVGAQSPTNANITTFIQNNFMGDGWWEDIYATGETDESVISGNISFSNVGNARMNWEMLDPSAGAPTSGIEVSGNHFSSVSETPTLNKYGARFVGIQSGLWHNNIINNHNINYLWDSSSGSARRQDNAVKSLNDYTEDKRLFVATYTARANSQAYTTGQIRVPVPENGYSYTAASNGTSAGSQPTMNTVLGGTTVDGGMSWTTTAVKAIPWNASMTVKAAQLVRPSIANANGFIGINQSDCTAGGTEPSWGASGKDSITTPGTITDGGCTYTMADQSIGFMQLGTRKMTIDSPATLGVIAGFVQGSSGAMYMNNARMESSNSGSSDAAFVLNGFQDATSIASFTNSSLLGVLRGYRTAATDTFKTDFTLDYTKTTNDTLSGLPSDGLAVYVTNDYQAVTTTTTTRTNTTTLADITGLTFNLKTGKTYKCYSVIYATSGVAGGVKAGYKALSGSTLTVTSIVMDSLVTDGTASSAGRSTTLGTAPAGLTATATGTPTIRLDGTIVVNAAGTISVGLAQNAADNTTPAVSLSNSTLQCSEIY